MQGLRVRARCRRAPRPHLGAGSVLTYVTEPESRKQRRRSPSCNSLIEELESGGLFGFVGHDVEHLAVGFGHGITADGGEVVDTLINVVVYYSFVASHYFVLHRK